MTATNPIFERHYKDYLRQLQEVDPSRWASALDLEVDTATSTARIPLFQTPYRVSPQGVVTDGGERPDYGICVILLKYLLMCPARPPQGKDWIPYREFPDSGQARDSGLAEHAQTAIAKRYAHRLERLQAAVRTLGGEPPETDYPYDVAAVIPALPRVPLLLLFNAADAQFAAHVSILYERRAAHYLDAECRVMIDWYLYTHLKSAEV